MKAFHDDNNIKQKYLKRVEAHFEADEIIKGQYWEDGKGCAVGCTIHDSSHLKYETELGIPRWLAHVEDKIFEGLPNKRAKKWPHEFLSAINGGSDLEKIKIPFLIFIVETAREKFDHKKYSKTLAAIDSVLIELKRDSIDLQKLRESRAYAAAAAYAYAAAAAADAAAYAADAAAAAYAAYAAAADAADAAAAAAAYAADAAAAAYAAREKSYITFADKLLELLKGCK